VSYQLKYTAEAKSALRTIPGNYRQRIRNAVEGLGEEPRPSSAEMTKQPNRYKIKFDQWRLIYDVRDDIEVVRILRIKLKSGPETYQGFEEW